MAPMIRDVTSTASPAEVDCAEPGWLGIWLREALVLVSILVSKVDDLIPALLPWHFSQTCRSSLVY